MNKIHGFLSKGANIFSKLLSTYRFKKKRKKEKKKDIKQDLVYTGTKFILPLLTMTAAIWDQEHQLKCMNVYVGP